MRTEFLQRLSMMLLALLPMRAIFADAAPPPGMILGIAIVAILVLGLIVAAIVVAAVLIIRAIKKNNTPKPDA